MRVLEKAVQPHGIVLRPTLQERAFGVVRKTEQLIGCDAQGLANLVDQSEVRLGLCALVARIAILVYAEGMRKATRAYSPLQHAAHVDVCRTLPAPEARAFSVASGAARAISPVVRAPHRRPQRRPRAANG